MPHLIWVMCLATASLSPLPKTSARDPQPQPQTTPRSSDPAAVMVQGPQVPPPSVADASAQELENLGDEQRTKKAFNDALEYYRLAMKKADSAELHNKSGIAYLQMLRLKAAEKEFNHAIEMNHDYAEAINNLGVVFYMRKKYPKAIGEYERALKLNDGAASFHSNLGMAYFEKKEFEQASAELVRALELDPQIFERQTLGGIAARMAAPEDRARYYYTLAKIYARQGGYDRSLEYLKKAVEQGYPHIKDVYTDDAFAGVRKDPRFATVMAKTEPLPN